MEEERDSLEEEEEEEGVEPLEWSDFETDDELDIDEIMDNFDGEDPVRLSQFYTFLQSVLQRDEEESDDVEKFDETGYIVMKNDNKPKHVRFNLDMYYKVEETNEITYKCDRNLETSRRSNIQFQVLNERYYGNQSTAHKENEIYFEVEIVHWRKKKYRTNPIIGIGFGPYGFENGMIGWSHQSVGYHADDGGIFDNQGMHSKQLQRCNTGDTMGCLWKLNSGEIFFTKNGELCKSLNTNEVAITKRNRNIYFNYLPSITTSHIDNVHFKVNLGDDVVKKPFKYPKFNILSIENCLKQLKDQNYVDVIFN